MIIFDLGGGVEERSGAVGTRLQCEVNIGHNINTMI